ncbi:hypothetical protein ABL78_3290 [Leptomonas seymouri]|uniref:EF-hand domain-containing protein n=1 Tax=Leptomonas seymouri TaxID=5684 RepID=A0A0N1PBY2_LEPSE|nr:hypothetical protein ABL78_3290 [Leptomonas seymouri]|eukprot:KPI87633.1 hypothetical protein ABL78_3290 [Leptomonas seymouri]
MKHTACPSPSPQLAKKPFISDIVQKAVERLGKKCVWRVATRLEELPSPAPAEDVREALRALSIFLSDEDYTAMVQEYAVTDSGSGSGAHGAVASSAQNIRLNCAALLEDLCTLPLIPRRQYVVELVIRKLDPDNTGIIPYSTLNDNYDVLRHPQVCSGLLSESDALLAFFENFETEGGCYMEQLTTAELRMYMVGLSTAMKEDSEFELWCMRGFCLDRPKMKLGEETCRLEGSRHQSRRSRLLGEGRRHPLYSTTYEEYGKEATSVDYKRPVKGRPQQFTKKAIARTGGATSMNM